MTKPKALRLARLSILCLLLFFGLDSCRRKPVSTPMFSSTIMARSRVSDGNPARLQRAMAKARRGEPITIGIIGGSIALGEKATDPSRSFASLVTDWWVQQFPQSHVTLVNAGVENTGSNYGCLRVQRDLLSHHPDFVIVEFGVNDRDEQATFDTYEGVVRQIAADVDQPAILLLFMMHHIGTNAQDGEIEIGRQYQLPMISYRDALWPEIAAGRMKLSDVFDDTVHPNDHGHAAVAEFIDSFLQDALAHLPADDQLPAIPSLPLPRFTDLFARTQLITADELQPVKNSGWIYDPASESLKSSIVGSTVEFDIRGSLIDLVFYKSHGPFGSAMVSVDGGVPASVDSWFEPTWGGFSQTVEVARNLGHGIHRVRVTLADRNPKSSGNEFHILAIGSAGD